MQIIFQLHNRFYFHAGILVRENRYAILLIINQTIYNMDKNKIHGFMDQLNLFLIGAVIGGIIGSCFSINAVKGKSNKAEEKVRAYEQYYKCTETLLDSLDGTHDLDLMDTDLETDYGVDYLEAKSKVDELIAKQNGESMKLQPTSGTHKKYKPGQLVTINHRVYRITKNIYA